jgi:RNA polymerase sigma-70 factor (ECF subfamily)
LELLEARRDRKRLVRLARGDASALEELYDRHAERLFGLALWLTRSRDDAEDIVQTVMVKLAGAGEKLLEVRRPAAYLVAMARSEALDRLEWRRTRGEDPLHEALFVEPAGPEGADRAEALAVRDAVASLPADQGEVVYLHVFEGWSFREIGESLDVSTFTAASRYRLALEKLRVTLGEEAR